MMTGEKKDSSLIHTHTYVAADHALFQENVGSSVLPKSWAGLLLLGKQQISSAPPPAIRLVVPYKQQLTPESLNGLTGFSEAGKEREREKKR